MQQRINKQEGIFILTIQDLSCRYQAMPLSTYEMEQVAELLKISQRLAIASRQLHKYTIKEILSLTI